MRRPPPSDAGRAFLEWTPSGPCTYNPYGHGSAGEIADKALAGERFTEPHYLRQAQRYLAHAVRALQAAGEVATPARAGGADGSAAAGAGGPQASPTRRTRGRCSSTWTHSTRASAAA